MTQVKVIMAKNAVYTTFYKTIHAEKTYEIGPDATIWEGHHNTEAARICRSLAFSLACSTPRPVCQIVDKTETVMSHQDVFAYLNECHPEPKPLEVSDKMKVALPLIK